MNQHHDGMAPVGEGPPSAPDADLEVCDVTWRRLASNLGRAGYRDGRGHGHGDAFQRGFDVGYGHGLGAGLRAGAGAGRGRVLGAAPTPTFSPPCLLCATCPLPRTLQDVAAAQERTLTSGHGT